VSYRGRSRRFRYDGSALLISDLIVTSPTPSPKRLLDIATGRDATLDVEEPFLASSIRIR
jgi:hypothetical protein